MEYGLIGEKLGHSFSKIIHNEIFPYDYSLKEIEKESFDAFIKSKDFKAINITIPYKEQVIPLLDFVDESARKIGAVNTVVNKCGVLCGYNTDYLGMKLLISKSFGDFDGLKVLILGSGGTSKTAKCVCEDLGAKTVHRVSRDAKKGDITYSQAISSHSDADVIINTTPLGMFPNIFSEAIDIEQFKNLKAVFDAVYNPISTRLITKAKEMGIIACGGLYMLVAQAFFAGEIFLDEKYDIAALDKVYNKLLKEKRNIVLIGMPSCGKTTLGKALAKELSREFVDTDDEIEKIIKMPISDFIAQNSEAEFRKIEASVIENIAAKQGLVIATGGGAVLKKENIINLKLNGELIFINRSLSLLTPTKSRPLSSNLSDLEKRYNERYPIYKSAADHEILANGTISENLQDIYEVLK